MRLALLFVLVFGVTQVTPAQRVLSSEVAPAKVEDAQAAKEYDDAAARDQARSMGMSLYYVYLLRKGPTWSPNSTPEIAALQKAHLANMQRLHDEGKLVLHGPLLDSFQLSGELRGIGVLKAASIVQAREWIATDPMVKARRLVFELHAWMVGEGVLP